MRKVRETAILLALLFRNAGLNRARISKLTFKKISGRKTVRSSFVISVIQSLSEDYGLYLIELETGGFGIVPAKSMEAAKPITANKYLPEIVKEIRKKLPLDFASLEEDLLDISEEEDDEDE